MHLAAIDFSSPKKGTCPKNSAPDGSLRAIFSPFFIDVEKRIIGHTHHCIHKFHGLIKFIDQQTRAVLR